MIDTNYRSRQDAQVALQAQQQIKYCEDLEMGRPKGSTNANKAAKVAPIVSQLGEALAFISVAATKYAFPYNYHCTINNGFVAIDDGIISAGYPIDETIECCPQYDLIVKAVKKCGQTLAFTQLPNGKLSIKGDNLKVEIPCLPLEEAPINLISPDSPVAVINDAFKKAFETVSVLADEKAERVHEASILLQNNICTATNGKCVMQYWHGVAIPVDLVISKSFCVAVSKVKQPITAIGYTADTSITFYFEGGMWIKTLLYADKWPEVENMLSQPNSLKPVPVGFFEAFETVAGFSEDNFVEIVENGLKAVDNNSSAEFTINGLQAGKYFNGEVMKKIAPFTNNIDFTTYPDRIFFDGEMMRGVAMAGIRGN